MLVKLGLAYRGIAEHMAIGARKITALDERLTTWGVALIGTDGPTQQDGKPVRLLYIGISSPDEAKAWGPFEFSGTREEVRKAAVVEALVRLHNTMSTRQGDKVSRVTEGIRRAYEELMGS
ncbi:hypothetical protein F4821DRAFT_222322 [Hypoxylon rubiginosum]|uniref:Uncharacterized protein n=1 Tax=Hypoxylon rubiginosum TaxID=110542 RepID=A0ACC0DK80_9PEZI|nr:hypothetical protein F4821DRAFT_222322 [Hypoxylon rubiginosum]